MNTVSFPTSARSSALFRSAADMFQRFKELGMLNPKAGMYYRKKILSRGGTIDELDMVRDYLGREPKMEPFLKHLGLTVESDTATGRR